jgi:hypothetical protein
MSLEVGGVISRGILGELPVAAPEAVAQARYGYRIDIRSVLEQSLIVADTR